MNLAVSIETFASGSTSPTTRSTSSDSGRLLMSWPPAILTDQPRGSPRREDHPLAVSEPLEAVGALIVLDQFGLGIDRDEPLAADHERKLGREGEQAAGDAPELLALADMLRVRFQERHLHIGRV